MTAPWPGWLASRMAPPIRRVNSMAMASPAPVTLPVRSKRSKAWPALACSLADAAVGQGDDARTIHKAHIGAHKTAFTRIDEGQQVGQDALDRLHVGARQAGFAKAQGEGDAAGEGAALLFVDAGAHQSRQLDRLFVQRETSGLNLANSRMSPILPCRFLPASPMSRAYSAYLG